MVTLWNCLHAQSNAFWAAGATASSEYSGGPEKRHCLKYEYFVKLLLFFVVSCLQNNFTPVCVKYQILIFPQVGTLSLTIVYDLSANGVLPGVPALRLSPQGRAVLCRPVCREVTAGGVSALGPGHL